MKRLFLFILAIPWFLATYAQSPRIVSCEYWMDGDMSNITEIAVNGTEVSFSIDISGLADGMHTLYYRVKDDQGNYSTPSTWLYMKDTALRGSNNPGTPSTIVTCEYWMDGDMDNITEIAVDSAQVSFAIDVSSLADGMHTLYYRVKDDKGSYSTPSTWLYMKDTALRGSNNPSTPSTIITCEYWMDGDMDNITEIVVDSTQVAFAIDVSSLADGMHTLYYRVKDDKGSYSTPSTWLYMKDTALGGSNNPSTPSTIVTCEYWMDGDMDNITEIAVDSTQVAFAIDVSSLADGMHTLYYRVKDDKGNYSTPSTWLYMKDTALRTNEETRITWYKFWWNDHQDKAERVEVECDTTEFILMRKLDIPDYVKTDGDTCFTSGKLMFLFGNNKGYSSAVDTADITFPLNRYLLTYLVDSTVYVEESIQFGDTLTLIAEPSREGHTFSGWSELPETMPARDVTIAGTFTANRYLITYKVNGVVYHTDSVAYGTALTALAEPVREGHTFSGWSELPETMPAGDVEVSGTFTVNRTQTDWQGVTYVLNEAGDAFEVSGYTDTLVAEVDIPSDLYGIPVTVVQEQAFIDAEVLESVVIPSSVTEVGRFVFTGCSKLLVVEWNATAPVRSACFDEADSHGNMLVFVRDAATEVTYKGNVIINGTAERIVLTDGLPFSNPREFTARSITYSHTFGKKTVIGEVGGWEALVLPFDVQTVVSDKGTMAPFGIADYVSVLPYWVAESQADVTFSLVQKITANRPFIVQMPNNEEYEDMYNVEGPVTFSATDVTVHATDDVLQPITNDCIFLGTYGGVESADDVYALNDEEYTATDGSSYLPGGVFVADSRDIRPFEAYIYSNKASRAPYLRIGGKESTGIEQLRTQDSEFINVYDLMGRQISVGSWNELPKGVYIINGKKRLIK